ncbi:hypothetical protein ACQPXT_00510 (plasmid) [Streptomyces sp. CA-100214]
MPGPGEPLHVPAGVGVGVGEQFALERGRRYGAGGTGAGGRVGEQIGEQAPGEGGGRSGGQAQGVGGAVAVDDVRPGERVGVVDGDLVEGCLQAVPVQGSVHLQGRVAVGCGSEVEHDRGGRGVPAGLRW